MCAVHVNCGCLITVKGKWMYAAWMLPGVSCVWTHLRWICPRRACTLHWFVRAMDMPGDKSNCGPGLFLSLKKRCGVICNVLLLLLLVSVNFCNVQLLGWVRWHWVVQSQQMAQDYAFRHFCTHSFKTRSLKLCLMMSCVECSLGVQHVVSVFWVTGTCERCMYNYKFNLVIF